MQTEWFWLGEALDPQRMEIQKKKDKQQGEGN
jgi:hypothetical protein